MRRRDLLGGLAALLAAGSAGRFALASDVPVIACLSPVPLARSVTVSSFRQGLADQGFIDGNSVRLEDYHADGGRVERFPDLAAEAVRRAVSLIFATGGKPAIEAAKSATSAIPIVFIAADDPVVEGLVESLSRPGRNLSGVAGMAASVAMKQLEVMNELLPGRAPIAFLMDPKIEASGLEKGAGKAADALGREVPLVFASAEADLDDAFARVAALHAAGMVVSEQPLFESHHRQLAAAAARRRVPAIYDLQDLRSSGGLISYGPSINDLFRQAGVLAGRILNGARPADLPVVEPARIQLKINLKTAEALGISVPQALLARADEVIE